MRTQRTLMGMTVIVEIVDIHASLKMIDKIFSYFSYIDDTFSTYKETSEITKINNGLIKPNEYSNDMNEVFALSKETNFLTNGYFEIYTPEGKYDPSGLVKGWAIYNAAQILLEEGCENFFIDIGGDVQVFGRNGQDEKWSIGIRNPFFPETNIVKVVEVENKGVATSGSYARGHHIYNPHTGSRDLNDILSMTVIGPNIYEADRYATAVFAMGKNGINFIENLEGFEGYSIDASGIATMTSNFNTYVL